MPKTGSPEYARFTRKLKAARLAAGLTQAQAARKLGKPQSFVSNCESGERRVDLIEANTFAKLYGCKVTDFL
ncbi:MAG: helix-turn-helix domain-containing protein [Nitriliruptorales bacterium]